MILRKPLRIFVCSLLLGAKISLALADFAVQTLRRLRRPSLPERALWLQRNSRRVLRAFDVQVEASGPRPASGLMVGNHLSYLDILVFSSITPAVFVSKSEIRHWPVFGLCAQLGGTLFVQRAKRSDVARIGGEIERVLVQGVLLILFPEGTSSDGAGVLPFKSSLLEPACRQAYPLSAACIQYEVADGNAGQDVCYWGDMTFFPHLLNLMSKRHIRARVRFTNIERVGTDRKELAKQLHQEVMRLKVAAVATK